MFEKIIDPERSERQEETVVFKESEGIKELYKGLNGPQRNVFDCIQSNPGNSIPKLSKILGIPSKSLERHIAVLADNKLIEHRGSKKTGGYFAVIRFGAEYE